MDYLTFLLWLLFGFLALLLLKDFRERQNNAYKAAKKFPGSFMWPIFGNLMGLLFMDAVGTFYVARSQAKKFGCSYRQWICGDVVLNAIRVKEVEKLLSSTKHMKKSIIYNFLHSLMGVGLLCSHGPKWLIRRRILTPAFHFNILQNFHLVFQEESDKLVMKLADHARNNQITHLQPIISAFTLNTICETAMGVKLDSMQEGDVYRKGIYQVGEMLVHRLMRPWLYENSTYTFLGYRAKLDKMLQPVHAFTKRIIQQRRIKFHETFKSVATFSEENIYFQPKQRYAMLDTLLAAEANGGKIDEEGIREEVDTFMFEGHDTTSSGLVFTLLLIAIEQDAQERVYRELQEIYVGKKSNENFSIQDYNDMKYLDRVIKESLRIYPPVTFIARTLSENLKIDEAIFPKNTMANIHIYDLHRDAVQFPDPEKFDPDRFLPENIEKRSPYAYIPFSAGPRNCIGQKFALLELKTVIATILLNYKLTPITQRDEIVFTGDLVLRAKTPIKVQFNFRKSNV